MTEHSWMAASTLFALNASWSGSTCRGPAPCARAPPRLLFTPSNQTRCSNGSTCPQSDQPPHHQPRHHIAHIGNDNHMHAGIRTRSITAASDKQHTAAAAAAIMVAVVAVVRVEFGRDVGMQQSAGYAGHLQKRFQRSRGGKQAWIAGALCMLVE